MDGRMNEWMNDYGEWMIDDRSMPLLNFNKFLQNTPKTRDVQRILDLYIVYEKNLLFRYVCVYIFLYIQTYIIPQSYV